jgi:hypothetical protein
VSGNSLNYVPPTYASSIAEITDKPHYIQPVCGLSKKVGQNKRKVFLPKMEKA